MTTSAWSRFFNCKLLSAALAATIVMGCSPTAEPQGVWAKLWRVEVGPDYKPPELKPVDEFRFQLSPSEAESMADLPWWKVFNDQVLQELIATALTHNYDLQLAIARVGQAHALVGVAASQLYPQISYEGLASRQKAFNPLEGAFENLTFNLFGGLFNAVWELDVWGRIRRSTEAARANLFAQEDIRRGVMLTLVSDVATAYFRLIEFDRELEIAHDSSKAFKYTLDLFTHRFQLGQDNKLPVERALAAYESSLAQVASLNRAIAQEENVISVLVGAYPEAIARGTPLTKQTMPVTPLGMTTEVIQRRPDILQAEQAMIGANAQVGVAVANFFPRIGLTALYGGQSQSIDDILETNFAIWNIAAGVVGPLFQGFQLIETYHAQQAVWDGTVVQFRQAVLVAFREVSDVLIAQQTLVDQRAALEGQVAALKESVDLSLLRYVAGRASYFEVLEAQQQLFPAEYELAQTQRDQLLVVVDLYQALGGGWNLSDAQWIAPH
jgi:outer membrane protein, multidrug efflux system